MPRILSIVIALLLALPAVTSAAPAQRRHAYHWHGYGFLPGYHQPPNNTVPIYGRKGTVTGETDYSPQYLCYDGDWHYFGRAGSRPRPLQRRQLRPMLELDADRPGMAVRAEVKLPSSFRDIAKRWA